MQIHNRNKEQQEATDTRFSIWTLASAGTGKTKVLIDRLLKLVLTGTDPKKILCLTFTNAAAYEIEKRIQSTLVSWLQMPEKDIKKQVSSITNSIGDLNKQQDIKQRIKHIYMNVITQFRVYTIHAFCQNLLSKFPFEADLKSNKRVISTIEKKSIITYEKKMLYKKRDKQFSDSVKILLSHYNQSQIESFLEQILEKQTELLYKIFSNTKDEYKDKIFSEIKEVNEEEMLKQYIRSIPLTTFIPIKVISAIEKQKAKDLHCYLQLTNEEKKKSWKELIHIFFNSDFSKKEKIFGVTFEKNNTDLCQYLREWQDIFYHFNMKINILESAKINLAFFDVSKAIFQQFNASKKQNALLDYNDLIYYTKKLLTNSEQREWIAYKLDSGFDHILIDEAQDTSLSQWEIIASLIENFFVDISTKKTVFIVGDPKQSIYGFQDANLEHFHYMQNKIKKLIQHSAKLYKDVELVRCYRSSQIILDFVFDVLEIANTQSQFKLNNIQLISNRSTQEASSIEIFTIPKIYPKQDNANDAQNALTTTNLTAKAIAQYIKKLLDDKIVLPSTKAKIQEKDIMILVQRRGVLSSNIEKECKKLNISVMHNKRGFLQDNLFIMDILSLARFVLFPSDNFNLICLLKSCFFNLDDKFLQNNLFTSNKSSLTKPIIEIIAKKKSKIIQEIYEKLVYFQNLYQKSDLYTFFFVLMNMVKDKVNISKCMHTIEEFLQTIKIFQRDNPISMQKFLSWFQKNLCETVDTSNEGMSVKITTAHSSKGLESPVIIIADAGEINVNYTTKKSTLLFFKDTFTINRLVNTSSVETHKRSIIKQDYQEYLRLMYVAFTRAKDCLAIFGSPTLSNKYNNNTKSWYEIAKNAMLKNCTQDTPQFLEDMGLKTKVLVRKNISSFSVEDKERCLEDDNSDILNAQQNDPLIHSNKNLNLILSKYCRYNETHTISKTSKLSILSKKTNQLLEGEIIHKLVEKISLKESKEDITNSSLFKSLSISGQTKVMNFFASNLYTQIMQADQLHIEAPIALQDCLDKTYSIVRPDLIIMKDDIVSVIDYKTDIDTNNISEDYMNQITKYKKAVSAIYTKYDVTGYIFWLENCTYFKI